MFTGTPSSTNSLGVDGEQPGISASGRSATPVAQGKTEGGFSVNLFPSLVNKDEKLACLFLLNPENVLRKHSWILKDDERACHQCLKNGSSMVRNLKL